MRIVPYAIKSAFIVGALTTGAFFTGAAIGVALKNNDILSISIFKNKYEY